jgi:hypothetical protein
MRHEEELEHAAKIEAAQPQHGAPIPRRRPDPSQTYHGRSMAGLDGDGVIGPNTAYVVGSEPTVTGPFAPSPIQWDQNLEPPLGEVVNSFEPCGTPAEVLASLPPDEGDGDEQA